MSSFGALTFTNNDGAKQGIANALAAEPNLADKERDFGSDAESNSSG